nr:MAG TPA: hypothetical protein [Caudoviricetes sp.]
MSKRKITRKRDKVVSTTTCNGVTVARTETETRIIMLSFVGTIMRQSSKHNHVQRCHCG